MGGYRRAPALMLWLAAAAAVVIVATTTTTTTEGSGRPPFQSTAVVAIADRYVSINSVDTLQRRIFGVTAYEGGGIFNDRAKGSKWLRRWGVTSVGLAAEFSDFALPPNLTEAGLREWLSVDGGGWRAFRDHSADPDPGHLVAGWLPSIGGGGAEPTLYLYSGLPGTTDPGDPSGAHGLPPPANGTLWGVAAAGVVRLVRHAVAASSGAPVDMVHIGNEPNNFMFRYANCSSTDPTCAPWEDFYSAAAATLKKEIPGIKIGGPVLCWGPSGYNQKGQPDWYTWHLWSKPTIQRGLREGTLDYFDFHAYSSDSFANRLLAGVHTVSAMGWATTGGKVLLPSAITETSFALPRLEVPRGEHFRRRTLPVARDILSLSAHPDKVILRQQHDLGYAPFRFNGGNETPTPDQQLYNLLAPLRGKRVEHELSGSNLDVLTELSHDHSTKQLVLAAANFENRTINLTLSIGPAWAAALRPLSQWTVRELDAVSLREAQPPQHLAPSYVAVQLSARSVTAVQ